MSEMGPAMMANAPTIREYAEIRVPSTDSAMPSSSPIRGRMGEMIMIWLLAAKTRSHSEKTMRVGDDLLGLKRHHPHEVSL